MQINGWDVANANAQQWNVTFEEHSVENDSTWVRGSPLPVLLQNGIGFKTMKVSLMVRGAGREAIRQDCSNIIAKSLVPAELILDHFSHRFYGILAKRPTVDEKVLSPQAVNYIRAAKLTLEFDCYEYGVSQ